MIGILQHHDGALRIESKLGVGTTVLVLLPCTQAPAAELRPSPARDLEPGSERLVLVIDDEEMVRSVARNMLENLGYRVLLAPDGRQGVELFREVRDEVDVVLLDVTMPGASGEQVFQDLRALRSEVPILFISDFSEWEVAQRMAGKFGVRKIHKPFRLEELSEAIRLTRSSTARSASPKR